MRICSWLPVQHYETLNEPFLVTIAGGVLSDSLIVSQTARGLREVFAPKASGSMNLAAAMSGTAAEAFAAFSSVAAFIGSAGQAAYAAANAAMDDFCDQLQSYGIPGTISGAAPASLHVCSGFEQRH